MSPLVDSRVLGRPDPGLINKRRALEMAHLEAWLDHDTRRLHWESFRGLHAVIAAVVKALGLMGRGLANARAVRLIEVEFSLAGLPQAFDGFSLLLLSDLHIDGLAGLSRAVAEVVSRVEVDLAVMTGDYRFEVFGPLHGVYAAMAEVLAAVRARWGVVGILGNHDFYEQAEGLTELGVTMLVNQALRLEKEGHRLWLLGLDDSWFYRTADLDYVTGLAPAEECRIMLCHSPDAALGAAGTGIDLFLTGHTHAGQIRLPLIGPLITNTSAPRRLISGAWRLGRMQGYTSPGTGSSCVPVRFNCPPEVTLIRLKAAQDAEV